MNIELITLKRIDKLIWPERIDIPPDFDEVSNVVRERIEQIESEEGTTVTAPEAELTLDDFLQICIDNEHAGVALSDGGDTEVFRTIQEGFNKMSLGDQKLYARYNALCVVSGVKLAQQGAQEYIDETQDALKGFLERED